MVDETPPVVLGASVGDKMRASREAVARMREDALRELAEDHARKLKTTVEVASLDKHALVTLVMRLARRLSAREGRQGE
jgi:hypothetical protein